MAIKITIFMFKRILTTGSYLFLILLGLFATARFFDVSLGGIYDGERQPYLQIPTSHSIVIRWQTAQPGIGVVRIGKSMNQVDKVFSETEADDEHSIKLTGLEPDTKYYYSVGAPRYAIYEGEQYWFKTNPLDKNTASRFWVTGDQGQAGEIQNKVRDAMLSWSRLHPNLQRTGAATSSDLDFWLTTGDNAYRSGTNQQFQDNFFVPYSSILRHTPVWPVYGNHDARRWVFFNIFSFPARAESGGVASATEKYYSFDYANIHVVVLDSQSSRMQKNSKMIRWLKKDLAATSQPWLIAVFHHPPYSKGTHNSDNLADSFNRMQNIRRHVLPVLEKAGVDVVLSGHSHMYERSWFMNCHYGQSNTFSVKNIQDQKPLGDLALMDIKQQQMGLTYRKAKAGLSAVSGTVYITIGSSARLDEGDLDHPAMPISLQKTGSMVFDVLDNKLTANFITATGIIADSFSIVKGDENAPVAAGLCQ